MDINYDNDKLLSPIIDAFTKVESQDARVERVTLERKAYLDLVTHKIGLQAFDNFSINGDVFEQTKGTLWGATVEMGNESKVYAEKGMIPSWDYDERTIHNENYRISADIEFKEFKYRVGFLKNLTIIVKSRADIIGNVPKNEMTAIETLREMITETEFRKYMVHGFILVKGTSGKIYQIFRRTKHTKVWYKGQLIEEICVRIRFDQNVPLTDNVIAFKIMIETDEEEFKKLGNVYQMKEAA